MNDYASLALGVVCAGLGGELFVRGIIGLAQRLRVSPGIIATTVAALATSSPELSVSITAALAGRPQISLGDALGSNVVNVALIFGIALLFSKAPHAVQAVRRDFVVALVIPVATGLLLLDGLVSRGDGLLLLGMFAAWLVLTIAEMRRQRQGAEVASGLPITGQRIVMAGLAGLALLAIASDLIVAGARGIALSFGIDEFIIGATLVAIGTSAPELATVLVSRLRGHEEIGFGTILGSNIFNGAFIVPVAAVIHPIAADWRSVAVTLLCGILAVMLIFPSRRSLTERRRGLFLLLLYAIYLAAVMQR